MKKTQLQRIKAKLEADGVVSNFWAIENYILRLGAIIHELKRMGWVIEGQYGKERGEEKTLWKNYYYTVKSRPKPWIYQPILDTEGRQVGVRPVRQ